ncbi:hypothetical protein KAR48_16535 [bacterium]|nr:hypothetical protein [bacterium]
MNIIQVENEGNKVAATLSGPGSDRLKLRLLVRFFQKIEKLGFDICRSYYLEFSSSFFAFIQESSLLHTAPDYLIKVTTLLDVFQIKFQNEIDHEKVSQCKIVVERALIQTWFVIGEWKHGIRLLEKSTGEEIGIEEKKKVEKLEESQPGPSQQVLAICSILREKYPQSYSICREILDGWTHEFFTPGDRNINLLLVEKENSEVALGEESGIMIQMGLRVKMRPKDVEEDLIRFNNEFQLSGGGDLHRIRDNIATVRSRLELNFPKELVNRHYSFHFSLPEKNALYMGDSWGCILSLLAYCGMINAYYGQVLVLLNPESTITGVVDMHSNLLAVDENGLKAKIRAAFFSPVKRFIVPWNNINVAMQYLNSLHQKYPNRHLMLESAETLGQLIDDRNIVTQKKLTLPRKVAFEIKRIPKSAVILLGGLLTILLLFMLLDWGKDSNPADFEVIGQYLVVKNIAGDELWAHDFGVPLDFELYDMPSLYHRIVLIKDLDGDKKNEVLLGTHEVTRPELSGRLFCFSSQGKLLWKYKVGKQMTHGGETRHDHYRIEHISVVDLFNDGTKKIVITTMHTYDFPSSLLLFDPNGQLLGEYWNSGRFNSIEMADLDGDGIKEIIIAGQNNETRGAILAILDPRQMWGTSPQDPSGNYYTTDVPKGMEKYYLRFPHSAFQKGKMSDVLCKLVLHDGFFIATMNNINMYESRQKVFTQCQMFDYTLNFNLQILDVAFTDPYLDQHKKYFDRLPTEDERVKLKRVQYWDGENWVYETCMNMYWRERQ